MIGVKAAGARAAVTRHLRDPVRGAGYALVTSSLISSGLGVVYWLAAAHRYTAADVGRGSAMVAAMTLVSIVAQLGLRNALVRFVPTAGGRRRLVAASYAVTGAVALLGAVLTLTLLRSLSSDLEEIGPSFQTIAWFAVATAAWTIFVLQDSVLTAVRRAVVVPVENLLFSVAKIGLLVAFATRFPSNGIFTSWTLPVFALVIPVTIYLFRSGLDRNPAPDVEDISIRRMLSFTAGEYVASSLWNTTAWLLPLIVFGMLGAEANAHYFLAWSTAYMLFLVPSNIGHALIAQAAREPARLIPHTRRALGQAALLVVPGALVGVLLAPWYLRLFGGQYEREATALLRLMLLAAIPNLFISTFVSVARVQLRIRSILFAYGSIFVIMVAGTPVLLQWYGVRAVGVLWLAAESAVAVAVVLGSFWALWVHMPGPRLTAFVGGLRPRPHPTARPSDITVTLPPASSDEPVTKIAHSSAAAEELVAARRAMAAVAAHPEASSFAALIPTVLESGRRNGEPFQTETRLPGTELASLLGPETRRAALHATADAIGRLHAATARNLTITDETLAVWFTERAQLLHPLLSADQRHALDDLYERVRATALGRAVTVSRVHGDLSPRNVLLDPSDLRVTGVVDWGRSCVDEPPETDLAHLLLTTRLDTASRELGQVVVDVLTSGWDDAEVEILEAGTSRRGPRLPDDVVVALTWLAHVTNNLAKSSSFATKRVWATRNIHAVLDASHRQLALGS